MRILSSITAAATLAALSGAAFAHTGSDTGIHHLDGMAQGFLHPFTGMDHLTAMIAIGIWSAMTARRIWAAPLSFAALLLAGALLGANGIQSIYVESMIAVSVLISGLLLATRTSLPTMAGSSLIGVFALFHGMAHGVELSHAQSIGGALAGMVAGTILLHIVGLAIGIFLLRTSTSWSRLIGISVSMLGIGLLSTAL